MSLDQNAIQGIKNKAKQHAFLMKRSVDENNFEDALKNASLILEELRTSDLPPRDYYDLFMLIVDELRFLEEFFLSLNKEGKPMVEIYEEVQGVNRILPRLYLLFTAGSAYIKSKEAPAKDLLQDMLEMCKGVQHPMRGLFLRNYLTHISRDKLPDVGSEYEGVGGSVEDAVDFITSNFSETNRLWVRMQNQGLAKDKKKREKDRKDLKVLIGTNLVRLSHLDGVDATMYKEKVFPAILEQVSNCNDTIAQSYLMDCIIQVFPDEFHLATLETFLAACLTLKNKVNVRAILEALMDRLANYCNGNPELMPPELGAFQIFNQQIAKILEVREKTSLIEILRIQTALLNFALKCYPHRIDFMNHCFELCTRVLSGRETSLNKQAIEQIERFASIPLSSLGLRVLDLSQFSEILAYLPWTNRKKVSRVLLKGILNTNSKIDSQEKIEILFSMIAPLLRDFDAEVDGNENSENLPENVDNDQQSREFEEEQLLVARLVHLIHHDDTDSLFRMFITTRKFFGQGGMKRIQYTLVPLVFAALKLSHLVFFREQNISSGANDDSKTSEGTDSIQYNSRKVFKFMHEILTAMGTSYPELTLKLFLQCAQGADNFNFKGIAYEFISQAFILYEDEITDNKNQLRALTLMVGTLLTCKSFDDSDYDALTTKTVHYAARLLTKPDQCRMISFCSHLFWSGKTEEPHHHHDEKRVLECLQQSLKLADVCMVANMHVSLFVEILNYYLYHFEIKNPIITHKYLSGLIALINEHIGNMDHSEARDQVVAHYRNTLDYIRRKQQDSATAEDFQPIVVLDS